MDANGAEEMRSLARAAMGGSGGGDGRQWWWRWVIVVVVVVLELESRVVLGMGFYVCNKTFLRLFLIRFYQELPCSQ